MLVGGDGFGVPYHTSKKIKLEGIDTVAVFGVGPIEPDSVVLQSYLGRHVIGIDRPPPRLELAALLGVPETILADDVRDIPPARRVSPASPLYSRNQIGKRWQFRE